MTIDPAAIHVAVVGAGLSGAACAAGLRVAGVQVTLFEKSRNAGGRMATRRATWADASGTAHPVSFDHGAHYFTAVQPRFRAAMARAAAAGCVVEWQPIVHASRSSDTNRCFVPTPSMPALCRHLLAGASLNLNATVRRLQRAADGTWFVATDGAPLAGPFHYVVVALPPAQAAVLLAGHQDGWAEALMARRMEPRWTLMAVTDDVDWPWDAAELDRSPLAWMSRNDRVPGRTMRPGFAVWTAHATAEWSEAHLEAEPDVVRDQLRMALQSQLPSSNAAMQPVRWYHADVQRWRYAGSARDGMNGINGLDGNKALWDESLGIGVCGDWLGGSGVEAAWHSGDDLADDMAASFEREVPASITQPEHIERFLGRPQPVDG